MAVRTGFVRSYRQTLADGWVRLLLVVLGYGVMRWVFVRSVMANRFPRLTVCSRGVPRRGFGSSGAGARGGRLVSNSAVDVSCRGCWVRPFRGSALVSCGRYCPVGVPVGSFRIAFGVRFSVLLALTVLGTVVAVPVGAAPVVTLLGGSPPSGVFAPVKTTFVPSAVAVSVPSAVVSALSAPVAVSVPVVDAGVVKSAPGSAPVVVKSGRWPTYAGIGAVKLRPCVGTKNVFSDVCRHD